MWDPYVSLVRLVGVEPRDPRVNKVVRDLCPGGDERPEVPHKISVVAACGRGTTAKSLLGLTSWRCSRRAATSSLEGVTAGMP